MKTKCLLLSIDREVKSELKFVKATILAILLLFIHAQVSAQQTTDPSTNASNVTRVVLQGVVTATEDGTAITGVNVYIKDTSIGTSTDDEGKFTLKHPFKKGDVIVFSFIGLETQYYTIGSLQDESHIQIKMSKTTLLTFGELAEDGLYTERRGKTNLWAKVKDLFE